MEFDELLTKELLAEFEEINTEVGTEEVKNICICNCPSTEETIACNGKDCEVRWFHTNCVSSGLAAEETWKCDKCIIGSEPSGPSNYTNASRPSESTTNNKPEKAAKKKPIKWKSQYLLENALADSLEIVNHSFNKVLEDPMLQLNPKMATAINNAVVELRSKDIQDVANKLVNTLWETATVANTKRTASEGLDAVCRNFHTFRINENSNQFLGLVDCDIAANFLFQMASEAIVEELLLRQIGPYENAAANEPPQVEVTKEEQQTLRYMAGYIPHKLLRFYRRFPNNNLANLSIDVLRKLEIEDNNDKMSFLDYSKDWITKINRGGLFKINNDSFLFFRRLECEVKPILSSTKITELCGLNLKDKLTSALDSPVIKLAWERLIGDNVNEVVVSTLFNKVIGCYIDIRCKAFTTVYMMERKKKDASVGKKGEKPLRKKLKNNDLT
ncbi:uncharacterized protein [Antedon mediterranea]|uniref:uncharacterized protein n=1 Tax=Antedon mediterranea TaxID=105859 RepID=UPI003AF6B51B